jgi:hypothetical protein
MYRGSIWFSHKAMASVFLKRHSSENYVNSCHIVQICLMLSVFWGMFDVSHNVPETGSIYVTKYKTENDPTHFGPFE